MAERHGLFRLHPEKYQPDDCDVDIVAIHGLGGHPLDTWTDEKWNGHLWLRDSLPLHVKRARIMTFGYDSGVFFNRNRMGISDFAIDLLTRLRGERQSTTEKSRPLMFICHSLGGVVIKEVIVYASLRTELYEDIMDHITAIVFMGTPHRGSRSATLAKNLGRIINVATLGSGVKSSLLETLEVSSHELEAISRHATQVLKKFRLVSFYEQKPLYGASLIVEPFSATLGVPNERIIPINADHRKIARVSPRNEQRYKPVWTTIKELAEASLLELKPSDEKLLDRLFCVDYKTAQLRPQQPHPGTCDWVFEHPTFDAWLKFNGSAFLLLSAPPGFGKSVITRFLSESIESGSAKTAQEEQYLGVSFFCSYSEAALISEEVVLRSLLHQLIQKTPRSYGLVRNRLEIRRGPTPTISLAIEDLWHAVQDVLFMNSMRYCSIIIDALDELGPYAAEKIMSRLESIIKDANRLHREHRLRFFISSRLAVRSSTNGPSSFVFKIEPCHLRKSIKMYLQAAVAEFVAQNSSFRRVCDASMEERLVDRIAKGAKGMFLWAVLAWGDFRRRLLWSKDVLKQALRRLESSPSGINALYETMMQNIEPTDGPDIHDVFSLLAVAATPLTQKEIGIILGICHSSGRISTSRDIDPIENVDEIIEQHAPGLVKIHDDDSITFVHLSFKEYILQEKALYPERLRKAKRAITRSCMKYLALNDLQDDAFKGATRTYLVPEYPFLAYASQFFDRHILEVPYNDSLWLLFADIAGRRSIYTLQSLQGPRFIFERSPLQFVIEKVPVPEQEDLIREFVNHGYDIEEKWSRGVSPLHFCCHSSSLKETALFLLKMGADPTPPSDCSTVSDAMKHDSWDLFDALVMHPRANLNRQDIMGSTVLHYLVASGRGYKIPSLKRIDTMDVNAQDVRGFTALHLAASLNKIDDVNILLNTPGVRLDVVDKQGRTPFTVAAFWGQAQVALALIRGSQAFPTANASHVSGLVFAAKHGQLELCRQLLKTCGYRNLECHVDYSGKGLLYHAAANDWSELLDECLQAEHSKLNVNKVDHSGGTALHIAAALGNTRSCSVLLKHGASATLQDRNGRTAPQAAADPGFKDTLMTLLLEGVVDPNQRDLEGRNLVHWAATIDCIEVMEHLAKIPGIQLARKDKHGKQPIDIAFLCKCQGVGRFLSAQMRTMNLPFMFIDIYGWDNMYNSPLVSEAEATASEVELLEEEDFQERESRRQGNEEEWRWLHELYPEERWGLVLPVKDEKKKQDEEAGKTKRVRCDSNSPQRRKRVRNF